MESQKYILFGAGQYAERAIQILGKEQIVFFVDNNPTKAGKQLAGIPIRHAAEARQEMRKFPVVISVSKQYQKDIQLQLERLGVTNVQTITEIWTKVTKEKLAARPDYIEIYRKAIDWIYKNTVNHEGIICTTENSVSYPEVTGYYIPTLLRWGHKDLAVSYAKWLCETQKEDGSWYDADNQAPYVFDTAQILKGLLAIRRLCPEVDSHIIKGCDWILQNMEKFGRLTTPVQDAWGDKKTCSELIHIYCLSPLVQAATEFQHPKYKEAADRCLAYYKEHHYDEIMQFGLLSHFYAYVMEGLLDLGEENMVREAMSRVAELQKKSGEVPAYHDVDWVCSTGLFQFALVWFRLGELERGNRAFAYACKLQNKSGGWYGSYISEDNPQEENMYFPIAEISWAVKYFLDALYWKNKAEFENQAPCFKNEINLEDERYLVIENVLQKCLAQKKDSIRVIDVGCGKGAYLKNLYRKFPQIKFTAVDISETVMNYIDCAGIEKRQGVLTDIPCEDNSFDFTYSCEALEHAVDISSAIRELARVTKPGGKIVIIDKNKEMLGYFEIEEWEQWFGEEELSNIMRRYCDEVIIQKHVGYEEPANGLFYAWIGTAK